VINFSIVVPTHGRPTSLRRLLKGLAELRYPRDNFEVIIVIDGGPDVVDEDTGLRLRVLRQENLGPAAARNHGAREAEGRYLAFTDDDCVPDAAWLAELDRTLCSDPGALLGGRTTNMHSNSLPTEASQLLSDFLWENYNPAVRIGAFFPSNNMAVDRARFLEMGGFDERLRFGEDREMCARWQARGFSFGAAPQAVVRHGHLQNLPAFLRLHYRYGGGTRRFRRTAQEKGLPRADFSSPLWYLRLLLYGVKREPSLKGVMLSLLLGLSQAACLAGYLFTPARSAARRRD
jgi:glycosyltransferase involved in cell wall biosynthesis